LRRVHAENAELARSLAAARAAAVRPAAARASAIDVVLDGLPVADPGAGAPRDPKVEYDLVELHSHVCAGLRRLAARQRADFDKAVRAARGAEEAALNGDARTKDRWLRALGEIAPSGGGSLD